MVNILEIGLFKDFILPFLLVFVVIFAILQKSQILGKEKAQIDALVSLAIALIVIVTPPARDFITHFIPWVAVGVAVILVFLLLYGFVAGDLTSTPTWMKATFGILSGIFVLGLVIYFSGVWSYAGVRSFFSMSDSGTIWANILLLVVIGGALAIVLVSGKKKP
jgi:hypothetical protein